MHHNMQDGSIVICPPCGLARDPTKWGDQYHGLGLYDGGCVLDNWVGEYHYQATP